MESDATVLKDTRKHRVQVWGHPENLAETDETRPGPGVAVGINRVNPPDRESGRVEGDDA